MRNALPIVALLLALLQNLGAADASLSPSVDVIQAQIVATRVAGSVAITRTGKTIALSDNDVVPQEATVTTGAKSSVILHFSNGTIISLAADSEVRVAQFLQDPYSSKINLSGLTEEPTLSRTRLWFGRGELVAQVKRLRHAGGSELVFLTPAGAIDVRGTTLRMRLTQTGQKTAEFSLEVEEGAVLVFPKPSGATVSLKRGENYGATIAWPP